MHVQRLAEREMISRAAVIRRLVAEDARRVERRDEAAAWIPTDKESFSFAMPRSSVHEHIDRIHSMTGSLRVPTAWPHDGGQHDKGSGKALKKQYADYNLNMLPTHAVNHGTDR